MYIYFIIAHSTSKCDKQIKIKSGQKGLRSQKIEVCFCRTSKLKRRYQKEVFMTISSLQSSRQVLEWVPPQNWLPPWSPPWSFPDLPSEVLGHILSFMRPNDLHRAEKVCKAWKQCSAETFQWKQQCQIQLGLHRDIDPKDYLPEGSSYKRRLALVLANVLNESVYKHYIGNVGPVPPIPEEISLKRWNEPDPCDSSKKIGTEYVWMYCPSHIEIDQRGYFLDKLDDQNNPEAPKLILNDQQASKRIKSEDELSEDISQDELSEDELEGKSLREIEFGAHNPALKVPVTINNLRKLFRHPKTGNPSDYSYLCKYIGREHGNKRRPAEWICMRKDVIGVNIQVNEQQALAKAKGVVIPELLPRILFNFMQHVRSKADAYPDGNNPFIGATTSTIVGALGPEDVFAGCGYGNSSGLRVNDFVAGDDPVGVAVALSAEMQAIEGIATQTKKRTFED